MMEVPLVSMTFLPIAMMVRAHPGRCSSESTLPWNRLQPSERHLPLGNRAKDPVDTQEKPGPTSPGVPISYAPKHTDDDGDCGIPRRPRRKHQLRGLEGACAIMRTRPTRSTRGVKLLPCFERFADICEAGGAQIEEEVHHPACPG